MICSSTLKAQIVQVSIIGNNDKEMRRINLASRQHQQQPPPQYRNGSTSNNNAKKNPNNDRSILSTISWLTYFITLSPGFLQRTCHQAQQWTRVKMRVFPLS